MNKKKCAKCAQEKNKSELDYVDKCRECKRKEESYKSSSPSYNPGPGDMFGTGIPGGLDCDYSTPW